MPSPALEALLILQDRDTKRLGLEAQLRTTGADGQDGLGEPDGPPEPVAQFRVLPGALL